MEIRYWNRRKQREETEKVYGDHAVRWLYTTKPGQLLADGLLSRRLASRAYGAFQSSVLSRRKIAPFIRDYGIEMELFEPGPFGSFNDFFIRRFKPGARPFERESTRMPAFAEARYLAYDQVEPDQVFPVKGTELSPAYLMGDEKKAAAFAGGALMIARLCPTDYHRFHYPDDGKTLQSYRVAGKLHSVNPVALKYKSQIFWTNERQVSILETAHFGKLAYIEVGAMAVGRIVQTHRKAFFERGEEKGYFLFGASTVIVLGEKGRWKPSPDLVERSSRGLETLVLLGDAIAQAT